MAFWSSQRLEKNLTRLVGHNELDRVDCNAITMRVGGEAYVTPGLEDQAPLLRTKDILAPKGQVAIPAGRFAFLLTEETVTIPPDVMGFISIKATFKSKGLVNVSGFHVDPGWSGPLIFAVFNAGPGTILLERGMDLFLLWIADLDEASKKHKTKPGPTGIPPLMINSLTGVVDSVYALEARINGKLEALSKKDEELRNSLIDIKQQQFKLMTYFAIAAAVIGLVSGTIFKFVLDVIAPSKPAANTVVVPIASLTPGALAPTLTVAPTAAAGATNPTAPAPPPVVALHPQQSTESASSTPSVAAAASLKRTGAEGTKP